MLKPIKDWDDSFANMAHVAGSDALPKLWLESATAYRKSGVNIQEDIPFGDQWSLTS